MWKAHFTIPLFLLLAACGDADRHTDSSRGYGQKTERQKPEKTDSNMYSTDDNDMEMNRAIATAKRTFPRFDSAFTSGAYEKYLYMIKVRFETPTGGEYIWLTDIAKVNGHYKGVVSDSPRVAKQVRQGDTVVIAEPDIADWMYGYDTVVHGAFTTRVILSRMTPKERDELDLGFTHHIVD